MQVAGRTILEPGAPVIWFTFPGAWHDIGRFHTGDGRFTGYYANILTPVERTGMPGPPPTSAGSGPSPDAMGVGASGSGIEAWHTTDLCLDVFVDPGGGVHVLDRDELEIASARGWIDSVTVRTAEAEAARLTAEARAGRWPPPVVDAWPLDRARAAAGPAPPAQSG
jgi:predicted RNA-binding protein associated with RNAse of E/G family